MDTQLSPQLYASDLTDVEWDYLHSLLPPVAPTGRPRLHSLRTILGAIFYQLRTGGAWRFLPQEWPPWQTVYHYLRTWRRDGTWERLHPVLREWLRVRLGRDQEPSAGSIDSQEGLVPPAWAASRGMTPARRSRDVSAIGPVDTEGLVLKATVHPANIMDRDGVKLLLTESIRTAFPRLRHVWLDTGYNGKDKGKDWIERTLGWSAQIVAHRPRPSKVWIFDDLPDDQIDWSKYFPPPGFRVLPRRWIVERTFGWQSQQRRLSKDYERLCATSEAWIYVAMIRLMLRRLTRF